MEEKIPQGDGYGIVSGTEDIDNLVSKSAPVLGDFSQLIHQFDVLGAFACCLAVGGDTGYRLIYAFVDILGNKFT